jgi:hypothetical protein
VYYLATATSVAQRFLHGVNTPQYFQRQACLSYVMTTFCLVLWQHEAHLIFPAFASIPTSPLYFVIDISNILFTFPRDKLTLSAQLRN